MNLNSTIWIFCGFCVHVDFSHLLALVECNSRVPYSIPCMATQGWLTQFPAWQFGNSKDGWAATNAKSNPTIFPPSAFAPRCICTVKVYFSNRICNQCNAKCNPLALQLKHVLPFNAADYWKLAPIWEAVIRSWARIDRRGCWNWLIWNWLI